jgi:tetratricopeptide (TPR) repeat protein
MSSRPPHRQPPRQVGHLFPPAFGLLAALCLLPASALAVWRLGPSSPGLLEPAAAETPAASLVEAARAAEEQAGAAYNSGRYEDALPAQQHSVSIHRQLVGRDPSQRPKLAASLHNLGVVLIRLGRKAEAVAPTEEALALYRTIPSANGREASSAMERPLRNLVLLYFEGNRPQEALPLADELVRLHQTQSPQDPALQAEQVDVLNLRASLLVILNRPQMALRDLDAAVALGRQLLRLDPRNPGLQYGLAGSLVNVSQVADLLGNGAQALKPAQEAEALLRQVARSQPQLIGDWAKALSRLGQAHARVGEPMQARAPLEESIDLLRLLARSGPTETLTVEVGGYRDDLAHALEALALVQQQLNSPQEARAAALEALELYRTLATVDPRYGKDVERTRAWLSSLTKGSLMRP